MGLRSGALGGYDTAHGGSAPARRPHRRAPTHGSCRTCGPRRCRHRRTLISLTGALAARRFHRALGADAAQALPRPVLDFHASGGLCSGGLLVQRGNWIGSAIATLGRLPKQTPDAQRGAPEPVVVRSHIDAAAASTHGVVRWDRQFPGGVQIKSRWYFDEASQLAVDSFTYLGIPDFAAFGFELVPVDSSNRVVDVSAPSGTGAVRGFRHVTKKVWILGVPLPTALSLCADGVSIAHEDGLGWLVQVAVVHPLFGLVVSYDGDVRLTADEKE